MIFGLFTSLLIACLAIYASVVTLKAYINAAYNKIDSLHWGVSFLSLAFYIVIFNIVIYIQNLISINYYTLQAIINSLHFIEIFAILYMLGVSTRLLQVKTDSPNKQVRCVRVLLIIFKIIVVSFFIYVISCGRPEILYELSGKQRIHLLSNYTSSIVIQYLKAGLLFIAFIFIPSLSYYLLMKIALILISMSEFLQAINIQFFNFSQPYLLIYEDVFALIGILSGTLSIIAINKTAEKHEEQKVERRKEPSTFGLIRKLYNTKNTWFL